MLAGFLPGFVHDCRLPRGRRLGPEGRGASEEPGEQGCRRPHRQRAVGGRGRGRASEFAARLKQFLRRNGLFKAKELVVLSDGAPWIRAVCEEILSGRKVTFVLDLYHAL